MTRKEAIAVLESDSEYMYSQDSPYNREAYRMAVEALEAEPVKHGKWLQEGLVDGAGNRFCRCSNCGKGDTQAASQIVPYCWWCGAKMDGGENDAN